jgi:hypothetical protein
MICLAFLAPTIIQSIAEDHRNLMLSFCRPAAAIFR